MIPIPEFAHGRILAARSRAAVQKMTILTLLLTLFMARVVGQLLVVLFQPRWLPPMKDWYSGLVAYPLLLPAQLAIIVLMMAMIRGVFPEPSPNRPLATRPDRVQHRLRVVDGRPLRDSAHEASSIPLVRGRDDSDHLPLGAGGVSAHLLDRAAVRKPAASFASRLMLNSPPVES